MSWPKYAEQLEYISAVTKMLNEGPKPPEGVGYYIGVQLFEEHSHELVGQWSDEIAPDCWSYEDTEPRNKKDN